MANWCYNEIEFSGETKSINKVVRLFKSMELENDKTRESQKPKFSKIDSYFFNIIVSGGVISFESKWKPLIESCVEIGIKHGVSFNLRFNELGNGIFGKAIFSAGNEEAEILELESDEISQVHYDEEQGLYLYQNETYESDEDAYIKIWEQKFDTSY